MNQHNTIMENVLIRIISNKFNNDCAVHRKSHGAIKQVILECTCVFYT